MALRALANMCAVPEMHALIGEHATAVLEVASEHLNQEAASAQARTAAATLLLNFSVFIHSSPASEEEAQAQILSAVAPALAGLSDKLGQAAPTEVEVARRLLLAVGTLAHSTQGAAFVKQLTADLGIKESVAQIATLGVAAAAGTPAADIGGCASQLAQVLG